MATTKGDRLVELISLVSQVLQPKRCHDPNELFERRDTLGARINALAIHVGLADANAQLPFDPKYGEYDGRRPLGATYLSVSDKVRLRTLLQMGLNELDNMKQADSQPQGRRKSYQQWEVEQAVADYVRKHNRKLKELAPRIRDEDKNAIADYREAFGSTKIAGHIGCHRQQVEKTPGYKNVIRPIKNGQPVPCFERTDNSPPMTDDMIDNIGD